MTDLEKLTLLMDEHTARAVRIGYALGFAHAGNFQPGDLPRDAPEYRALETLGITSR
jgi:hypothetical protein